jgi:GAF domain-containing protein
MAARQRNGAVHGGQRPAQRHVPAHPQRQTQSQVQLNVRVSPALYERVRDVAAAQGRPIADAVAEALVRWVQGATGVGALDADPRTALASPERLEALRRTGLLDTPAEEAFDRLTRLMTQALGVPVALVSLVDDERQFFKSCAGLAEPWASRRGTGLERSFCQHVVAHQAPLVVEDARAHPTLRHNLAIEDLGVVAYAGVPLVTAQGYTLGSLCAIDTAARVWPQSDVALLEEVARVVVAEIEARTARRADEERDSEERFRALGRLRELCGLPA